MAQCKCKAALRPAARTSLEAASLVIVSGGRPAVAPRAEDVLLVPRRGVVADIVIAMAAAALPVIQSAGRPSPSREVEAFFIQAAARVATEPLEPHARAARVC